MSNEEKKIPIDAVLPNEKQFSIMIEVRGNSITQHIYGNTTPFQVIGALDFCKTLYEIQMNLGNMKQWIAAADELAAKVNNKGTLGDIEQTTEHKE